MRSFAEWRERAKADLVLLRRCKAAIELVAPGAKVILYGSRARGDAAEDSDYDLLVIVDGKADADVRQRIRDAIFPIELETGAVLTLNAYSSAEWSMPIMEVTPYYKNIEREGVLL